MTTLVSTHPRARRTTRCTSCGQPIQTGERYHYWKGTGDLWPGIATAKECAKCCERYGRAFDEIRPPFYEGCAQRGGICDCGTRPCAITKPASDETRPTPGVTSPTRLPQPPASRAQADPKEPPQ